MNSMTNNFFNVKATSNTAGNQVEYQTAALQQPKDYHPLSTRGLIDNRMYQETFKTYIQAFNSSQKKQTPQ